jgi:hypothetical protein
MERGSGGQPREEQARGSQERATAAGALRARAARQGPGAGRAEAGRVRQCVGGGSAREPGRRAQAWAPSGGAQRAEWSGQGARVRRQVGQAHGAVQEQGPGGGVRPRASTGGRAS